MVPTVPPGVSKLRAIVFGLECQTTRIVLDELLSAGGAIAAVCLPGPSGPDLIASPVIRRPGEIPIAVSSGSPSSVTTLARKHDIAVWRTGNLKSPAVRRAIQELNPDVLVVACFDRLIPEGLYRSLPYGGLNLHPSLLPDMRGPDPLFWTFHAGKEITGATVHRLTGRFDAGPIVAQASLELEDGVTEDELDARLARLGGRLLVETLEDHLAGMATDRPQNESIASWVPHPDDEDWVIDKSWPARRAFNFVRGLAGRNHPIIVRSCEGMLRILDADRWQGFDELISDLGSDEVPIRFSDGVLIARVAVD